MIKGLVRVSRFRIYDQPFHRQSQSRSNVTMMVDDEDQYIFLSHWLKKICVFIRTISLGAHPKTFLLGVVKTWAPVYPLLNHG